jgi:hypothetical protein
MGEVWKARNTRLDRIVAIKISERELLRRASRLMNRSVVFRETGRVRKQARVNDFAFFVQHEVFRRMRGAIAAAGLLRGIVQINEVARLGGAFLHCGEDVVPTKVYTDPS